MYHNPILLKVISVVLHDILKGLRHCIKKKVSTMTLDNCSTTVLQKTRPEHNTIRNSSLLTFPQFKYARGVDMCALLWQGHHPRILALPEVVSQTELEAVAAHGGVFPVPSPHDILGGASFAEANHPIS
ncbi:hypothetical protein BDA96_05G131800 [Sorghum bicolor]|uniref:Uncharacterized protein n=1 Tax=Sorghum bicolor TaxID=4558 RepID=A0A921QZM9_SORBI|nr:hypothetical protein BDA96_05G131800 [Sorghum bicolor]